MKLKKPSKHNVFLIILGIIFLLGLTYTGYKFIPKIFKSQEQRINTSLQTRDGPQFLPKVSEQSIPSVSNIPQAIFVTETIIDKIIKGSCWFICYGCPSHYLNNSKSKEEET